MTRDPLDELLTDNDDPVARRDTQTSRVNYAMAREQAIRDKQAQNPKPKPPNVTVSVPKKGPVGEVTMKNVDKIVDRLFVEALPGGPRNITGGDAIGQKGGVNRQQLAGEMFGSPAWPYDFPTSEQHVGADALMVSQAQDGLGDMTGTAPSMVAGVHEEIVRRVVDELTEGTIEDGAVLTVTGLIEALTTEGLADLGKAVNEVARGVTPDGFNELLTMARLSEPKMTEGTRDALVAFVQHARGLITEEAVDDQPQAGDEGSDPSDTTPEV